MTSTLKRKQLGRYDTPRPLCQAIVDWAIRSPIGDILEPSAGSGVFVRSALCRLRELGIDKPEERVWACDIDPHACAQTKKVFSIDQQHVIEGDFLSLVSADGFIGRKFKCVVGNPPFVSLHRMDPEQRLRAWAMTRKLGFLINRKASLWAYFVLAAISSLEDNGNLALILPETVLHAEYAQGVLRILAKEFGRCALLSIRERCFLDGGAAERIVVLLCEDFGNRKNNQMVIIDECSTVTEAEAFLKARDYSRLSPNHLINHRAIPHLLSSVDSNAMCTLDNCKSRLLGDFAEVQIGVVTGCNKFFVLSEPDRIARRIPESALVPLLTDFRVCKGLSFQPSDWRQLRDSGKPCWLLYPRNGEKRKRILRYLGEFPEEQRIQNRTFAKREPWYIPQLGQMPDAFLQYLGTAPPRVLLSSFRATCTNSIHRVLFRKVASMLLRKAIVLSLHSSFSRLSAEFEGRAYGSGALKIEPSEAKRIRLLLPEKLDEVKLNECVRLFLKANNEGDRDAATGAVDEWLYSANATLRKSIPLNDVRSLLNAAVERRHWRPNRKGSGRSS